MIINNTILNNFGIVDNNLLPDSMLINRVDSKFFFHLDDLKEIILQIAKDYSIIDYGYGLVNNYLTEYYDTEDFVFYRHHHNKKNNRLKLRFRSYVNSEIDYFEIKRKKNGKTLKDRKKIFKNELNLHLESFKTKHNYQIEIETKLFTQFNRVTFVDHSKTERVTLDFNLKFYIDDTTSNLSDIVVLELKQERLNRNSSLFKILRNKNIRKSKFSKYFVGVNLLYPEIKNNTFKETKLKLDKMNIKGIIC